MLLLRPLVLWGHEVVGKCAQDWSIVEGSLIRVSRLLRVHVSLRWLWLLLITLRRHCRHARLQLLLLLVGILRGQSSGLRVHPTLASPCWLHGHWQCDATRSREVVVYVLSGSSVGGRQAPVTCYRRKVSGIIKTAKA